MSHFTKVRTQLTERETLKLAMERTLKWPVLEDQIVRGYNGNAVTAQLVARNPSAHYDVGFARQRDGEAFELVADFYGLTRLDPDTLTRDISQNYALTILEQEAAAIGYAMGEAVVEEDGSIRVVLNQW
jgi:hypothetical protein